MHFYVNYIAFGVLSTFLSTVITAHDRKEPTENYKLTYTPMFSGNERFTRTRGYRGPKDYQDYTLSLEEDYDEERADDYGTVVQILKNTLERSNLYSKASNEGKSNMLKKADEFGAYLLSGNDTYDYKEDITPADADNMEMLRLIRELKGHSTAVIRKIFEYFLFTESPDGSQEGLLDDILTNSKKESVERTNKKRSIPKKEEL